jgi:formylglycine-generating enzyme required for sulfatase activity
MLPGEHTFTATKIGYHPLSTNLDVTSEPDQTFNFELLELPGKLTVVTEPETAGEVFLNQIASGSTPLNLDEIDPGLYDISIRSDRFLDYDSEITIIGRRQENTLVASLSPAWAMIGVETAPSGATISVEGEILGTTPATVEVLQGYRGIEITKPGYKMFSTNIDVSAGVDQALANIVLEKADGKIALRSTPAGANITVNGRYRGQTPLSLTLAPNQAYKLELSKAGYEPFTRDLELRPDQDLVLDESLQPILGVLRVAIEPENSTLYIDGVAQTDLNQRISLTAKPHDLRVSAPGYADYVATVTPHPGSTQQLVVRLQTEAEAAAAAIPTTIETSVGLALKLIIPDKLTMGAGRREPGRRSNEIQKQVELTRAFYLATTELTNLQYKAFDSGHDSGMLGRALLNDDNRPVVNVSWNDAARFCNWLSQQEGLPLAYKNVDGLMKPVTPMNTGYRLPTEAEWSWAARYASGPTPSRFPWGDAMPPATVSANYADESAANMVPYYISDYTDNYRGPSPVKTYTANEFGIYDLAGNVAEWIHDYYSLSIPRETLVDPAGPEHADYHVIRGSSYKHGRFSELRWTYRDYGLEPRADVGIRVARYLE